MPVEGGLTLTVHAEDVAVEALLFGVGQLMSREHEDRQITRRFVGLEGGDHGKAIDIGHEQVADEQVDRLAAGDLERLGAAVCQGNLEALRAKGRVDEVERAWIVVRGEHSDRSLLNLCRERVPAKALE